jgi:hypothetical protein
MKQYFMLSLFLVSCTYLTVNQKEIDIISDYYNKEQVSTDHFKLLKGFYDDLIFWGGIVYPESSAILKHYLYGDGSELHLESEYFFNSEFLKTLLIAIGKKSLSWTNNVENFR